MEYNNIITDRSVWRVNYRGEKGQPVAKKGVISVVPKHGSPEIIWNSES